MTLPENDWPTATDLLTLDDPTKDDPSDAVRLPGAAVKAVPKRLLSPENYSQISNVVLYIAGIGTSTLGGVELVNHREQGAPAVAIGLGMAAFGYISAHGGIRHNARLFWDYMIEGFSYELPEEAANESIELPPVMV